VKTILSILINRNSDISIVILGIPETPIGAPNRK